VRVPCVPQELSTVRCATSRCAQVAARAELDVDLHACAPSLLEREEAAILLQQKLTKAIRPRTPCHAAHAYTYTHAGLTEGPRTGLCTGPHVDRCMGERQRLRGRGSTFARKRACVCVCVCVCAWVCQGWGGGGYASGVPQQRFV
jgi:hypothetical protein